MMSACFVASSALTGLKPWLDRQVVVRAAGALADDDVEAAVAEVLGLGVALRAVADDGDRLALEEREVGVVVVVDRGGHVGEGVEWDQESEFSRDAPAKHFVRQFHASDPWTASASTPAASFSGRRRGGVGAADAADHGDAAGADQLDDAERPHQVDEGFDLFFLAGDFDDHFLGRHRRSGRGKFRTARGFRAALPPDALHLDQHQVAFDEVLRADVVDADDGDDLFELLADLLQRPFRRRRRQTSSAKAADLRSRRPPSCRCCSRARPTCPKCAQARRERSAPQPKSRDACKYFQGIKLNIKS